MRIDPSGPIPIYFQLKTLLKEAIQEGRFGPEDRLPTEDELCRQHGISRTPVHRALSELADEGVIVRYRRRGTFVHPHWMERRPGGAELRVVVLDEKWEPLFQAAAPAGTRLNFARFSQPDLHQAITHAVAEARAPDLSMVDSVWVAEFATSGFLTPLDEVIADLDQIVADVVEPLGSAFRHNGQIYALPAEADVAGLWFRRSQLERLGLDPPSTWKELRKAARAIHRAGLERPLVMPAGSRGQETTTYCLLAIFASNGVQILQEGGVTLDCPAAIETLRFLRSLTDEGLLPAEVVNYEFDRPIRMLAAGKTAFIISGSYELHRLADRTGQPTTKLDKTFGFVPIPAGPSGRAATLAGGMAYSVFRQAARPDLAGRLLQRLVAPEALADMARSTGQIPPRRSAVPLATPDLGFLASTAAMLENAVTRPATPVYARVSDQLQMMLEAVLTHRLSPAAAVARAADRIGAITGLPVDHGG